MYLRTQIVVVSSEDSNENSVHFKREAAAVSELTEQFDAEMSGAVILAASEADYGLPMGKVVTGKVLYLETDQELTIKLDGEATGHKVGAPTSGTKAKIFIRGDFTTAPIVTNNATEEATVSYLIAGQKS